MPKTPITQKLQSATNATINKARGLFNSVAAMEAYDKVKYLSIILIVVLVLTVIYYIQRQMRLNKQNCKLLKKVYNSSPTLVPLQGKGNPYLLRDYYVKTAYNCCSSGQFKNDFVALCALQTCIQQGVRCLDFEIYSINDQPVIAASSVDDFTVKETYNYVKTADAFNTILNMAFSSQHCPNASDPLILHFRMMSKNAPMYETLANQVGAILNSRTLGRDYSYENDGKNLGAIPIKNFLGKIIIIADATNPLYQKTKLDEYVNMASGSPFMRVMHYQQLKYTQDLNLKDFNKQNMSIVLPDWSGNDDNPNFNIARQYGCQLIAMSFQNFDSNLEHYAAFFDGEKTAFVLKPTKLRYVPLTVTVPPTSPENYSYQSRPITADYYNFKI